MCVFMVIYKVCIYSNLCISVMYMCVCVLGWKLCILCTNIFLGNNCAPKLMLHVPAYVYVKAR